MKIQTYFFNHVDFKFIGNSWNILNKTTTSIAVSAVVNEPSIGIGSRFTLDQALSSGMLVQRNGDVPVYTGSTIEQCPFYFDSGVIYFGLALLKSDFPHKYNYFKGVCESIFRVLSEYGNVERKGQMIFSQNGEISSTSFLDTPNRYLLNGFICLSPDREKIKVMGNSLCLQKSYGTLEAPIEEVATKILEKFPIELNEVERIPMNRMLVEFITEQYQNYTGSELVGKI